MKLKGLLVSTAVLLSVSFTAVAQSAANWPQWRGPNRDGISKETGLLKQWPAGGPPLVWKATGAGRGYSNMSSAGGRIYTMGLRGERESIREYVIAFDVATGKEVWATAHGDVFLNDRGD